MENLIVMIRKFRVLMMVASLAIPGWGHAADISWIPERGGDGFSVSVPHVSINTLLDEITVLKGELKSDETRLAGRVEEKRVTGNDNVLAFLLPGGLIYAAYRKNAYENAVKEHGWVNSRLREISADLVTLAAINGPIRVANR